MDKLISILAGILISTVSIGQVNQKYHELTDEARGLYNQKEYFRSGIKFSEAFKCAGDSVLAFDRIAAASSWAMAGLTDSAFLQLSRVARDGNFIYYNYLIVHQPGLVPLHSDPRWNLIIQTVKNNFVKKEKHLNMGLVLILDSVYQTDQLYQQQYAAIQKKYGLMSAELESFKSEMQKQYSRNLTRVAKILDEEGWLGVDKIGHEGNLALFLVIQHSGLDAQVKYLPMMREAVKKKDASAANLAYLEDRVAIRQGKMQIYGTQIERDEKTGRSYLAPLRDPDSVDIRRAEIGLEKLSDYLSSFGIVWDPAEYKKNDSDRSKRF